MMAISLHSLYWLVGGLILSVIPYSQHIPAWVMAFFLLLCVSKLVWFYLSRLMQQNLVIVTIVLLTLTLLGVVGVYLQFGTIFGLNAGSVLLILLASLKTMEIKCQRDCYIVCLLSYFLVAVNFLYSQTLGTAIYMAFVVFIVTLSLVSLNDCENKISVKQLAKITTSLLLQSIPIMLILFILFPRVSGSLWGMPSDEHTGITGIDDEMSPGSISQLIQSDEIAFRVDFKSAVPENSALYWRGVVLTHSDGFKWTRGKPRYDGATDALQPLSPAVSYTVTLEAHNKKWLYALDMASGGAAQGRLTSDFQLRRKSVVNKRIRYEMSSYVHYKLQASRHDELETALQLPSNKHEKTKALMQQWVNEGLSEQQIIKRVLNLFNQDEYYYTLTPPVLTNDRVDQFMFQTKQGYCEHYANAFAVMMRAAGIPSRVVLGYQGGEYNSAGDYFTVYQRNAHAWTEVWIAEQGWVRFDPTAAVSPSRINEGISSLFPDGIVNTPFIFNQINWTRNLWGNFRNRWDALNNTWYQWVISYDENQQGTFLSRLGLPNIDWGGMVLLILGSATFVLLYLSFMLFKFKDNTKDPVKRLYDQFCKKLSRCGIHRILYEGPLDFAQRAALKRTDLADRIHGITDIYIAVRYGSDRQKIKLLNQYIKAFKV